MRSLKGSLTRVLVLGIAAGCTSAPAGGGGGTAPIVSPSPGASVEPGPGQAQTVTVTVRNVAFLPASVEIPRGGSVTWRFEDAIAHTSTSVAGSALAWDSGLRREGETFTLRFDTPGTYSYQCIPHPQMRGTVIVR